MDFDALDNISDFVLNESLLNDSTKVIENIIYAAEPATGGWFGLVIMLAIYVSTLYFLYRDDDIFRLNTNQASVYASFLAVSVGIILFVTGVITDYRQVMWMAVIFLGSIISVKYSK